MPQLSQANSQLPLVSAYYHSQVWLWFRFCPNPLRFSLDEFHLIIGLNYGAFDAEDSEVEDNPGYAMWNQLFDTALGEIMVPHVLEMLRNPHLAAWKHVPLALISLVDGVLCCSNKTLKLCEVP